MIPDKHCSLQILGSRLLLFAMLCMLMLTACENTDLQLATEAGMDAIKAATLTDKETHELAVQAARYSDSKNRIAPPGSKHAMRLQRLVGDYQQEGGNRFNYAVYLVPEVNAFAMADGTIRVYSGLMDMLTDGELRFVIGHEMGHVDRDHIKKKIQMAYAVSAVRKGVASQTGTAGDIARSVIGNFAQSLMNAQFSQLEEKQADDYGVGFLKRKSFDPKDAVTALRKIADLGGNHSFLSTHPDPSLRAQRLQRQLEGKMDETPQESGSFFADGIGLVKEYLLALSRVLRNLVPGSQQ